MNMVLENAATGAACECAVLWELGPYRDSALEPSLASYFPVAQWPSEPPLDEAECDSLLGRATREGHIILANIDNDPIGIRPARFKHVCAVPLSLEMSNPQVLTMHRSAYGFRESDIQRISTLAELVPIAQTALQHNIGFRSSRSVAEVFDNADAASPSNSPQLFADLCVRIAQLFHAVEVSMFLQRDGSDGAFDLAASTWPGPFRTRSYAKAMPSLTSYVLTHNVTVRVADLRRFEIDRERVRRQYPNIAWSDGLEIAKSLSSRISSATPISFIAAPITFAGAVRGALRCCAMLEGPFYFTDHDVRLLQFLSTRIAQHLAMGGLLRAANERVIVSERRQAQAFEDVAHQLRSPAETAHHILSRLLKDSSLSASAVTRIRAVKGLVARAKRVTKSTGLFANLAEDHPIEIRTQQLTYARLSDLLSELTSDLEALIHPNREIRVILDEKSLDAISRAPVSVDIGLLEQAVASILDNAAKYSYPKTAIKVSTGVTVSGRFNITVTNRGLKMTPNDIRHAGERGWRGEWARQVTSEGSGIGLWLVQNIMRAHGGELQIIPTTQENDTEVKLLFPTRSR